jgi:hypothetical protein
MSTPIYTPPVPATVDGIGPYAVPHPYGVGDIAIVIVKDGARTVLASADFTVTPASSPTGGNVVLSETAAALHDGAELRVVRATDAVQQWLPAAGAREASLASQLDVLTRAVQDQGRDVSNALRADVPLTPFVPLPNRALIFNDQGQPVAGPTAQAIADAEATAAAVIAAAQQTSADRQAVEAAAAATAAAAAQLGQWRGPWEASTAYGLGDRVTNEGSTYRATEAFTSTSVFANDLAIGYWEIFAARGAPGAGTGDMLAENNLSEVNPAIARANIGAAPSQVAGNALLGRSADEGLGAARNVFVRNGIETVSQAGVFGAFFSYLQGVTAPRATWGEGDSEDQAIPSPRDVRQTVTDWALARLPGYGQERQDLTSSRSPGAVYQNDTLRPIELTLFASATSGLAYVEQSPNGSTGWVRVGALPTIFVPLTVTIPPGAYYRLTSNASINLWTELRSTAESELAVEYDGGDVPLSIETT